jgi:hypothetical protein
VRHLNVEKHTHMNNALLFFLFLTLSTYSQHQFVKIDNAKTNNPTYVVNNEILISYEIFLKLKAKKIDSVNIIKYEVSNDEHKNHIPNLSEFGLIQIYTSETFKSKTQNELKLENDLPITAKLFLDGYYIDNPKYKIEIRSVNEIEIIKSDIEIILNIWTLPKNVRQISLGGCSLSKKKE